MLPTRSEYAVVVGDRMRVYANGKRSSFGLLPGTPSVSPAWRYSLAVSLALRGHNVVVLQVIPGGLK